MTIHTMDIKYNIGLEAGNIIKCFLKSVEFLDLINACNWKGFY